ncbi:FKBP12-associated protein [Tulasnella sp. 418]|nr:FKBP12-associated protein [Tulasnella sp. 418]
MSTLPILNHQDLQLRQVRGYWTAVSILVTSYVTLENVVLARKSAANLGNYACPETEPCKAIITLKCACGRLQQPATCGISTTSPTSRANQPLPCLQDCLVAKRNERLASALGISPDRRSPVGNEAKYSESLQTFFKANSAFAAMVEKNLNDFITSSKRMVVLAPMPPPRRKFVRELAEVYRLDTEEVDQEPRRSVQLLRRIDSRIPNPLLSAAVRPVPTGKQSGLVALKRTGVNTPPIASTSNATPSSSVPVKMAWGTRPANVAQPSPSSTPAPSTSMTLAASFAAMNVTPPVSRPRTPPVTSQVPTIASAPIAGFAPEEVPESWEED